jgi:PAS domain S-box-containing protein
VAASRLQAIAHEALLDQLARGDARRALQALVSALATELGGACALRAHDGDGALRWSTGNAPDGRSLPLEHLGRRVGWLVVPSGADIDGLESVTRTAAALLARDAEAGGAPSRPDPPSLLHAALVGADTSVWEWNIESDELSDTGAGQVMLGYAAGELGPTQTDWERVIHPDDLDANHAAYERHERGQTDSYEHAYRARAADGSWRWILERGRIVERRSDGRPRRMLGTQTDITGRDAAGSAATAAAQRLMRVTRHVPGVLFQFRRAADGHATFPYLSERSQALFEVDPDSMAEDAAAMLRRVEVGDRDAMLASIAASARTLLPWRLDFRLHRRDGGTRWLRGEATPQRQSDGATVWHGYIEDATERRDLEQARHDALVAAAANRAKTEFLSRMSHELRTPLNAVLGFAQLLEIDAAEPPSEGQRRRLKLIREAGEHLLQMIGDLLDLTRIESGGMALQFEAVALRPLAEQAVEMLRASAEKAQVSLRLASGGADAVARADPTRLRQVLLNLLSNAIKYNRPGGSVDLRVLRVDARRVSISVRDTGIGIDETELARLFEPFHRGAQTRGPVEGTGIGLSVTQALVALMDGRIEVQSAPGTGSTFAVTLPAA